MITVEEHLANVLALLPAPRALDVPVTQAAGLVLAADVVARVAVPPFDNSSMDGFAVVASDVTGASAQAPVTLPVVADIPAGSTRRLGIRPGQTARIMTGAPMPDGADAVVPIEATDHPQRASLPAAVAIREPAAAGAFVRRAGGDTPSGALDVPAGTVLTPAALASIIAVGHGTVPVFGRPRVAVLATGSELVTPGAPLEFGQIPDSNTALVAGLCEGFGADVVATALARDDAASLDAALAELSEGEPDLIVSTGGVSVGAYDVVRELDLQFSAVAMQPGKPQAAGLVTLPGGRRVPLLGVPGNPVSVFVSCLVFVAPAVAALAGRSEASRDVVRVAATTSWRTPPGRRQYLPVVLGSGTCTPTHALGSASHLVAALWRAEGLAVVPAGVAEVAAGDELEVWRLV